MPYCGQCGTYFEDGANFCPACGAAAVSGSGAAPRQTAQQTAPRPAAAPADENVDPADFQASKTYAILAYLGVTFFLPLVVTPNSKYGRYHANQGLLLLITSAILGVAAWLLQVLISAVFRSQLVVYGVPTGVVTTNGFGVFLIVILSVAVIAAIALLLIVGMMNAAAGRKKPLPVIGNFTLIK